MVLRITRPLAARALGAAVAGAVAVTLGAAGVAGAASTAPQAKRAAPPTLWVTTQAGVVPINTATNKAGKWLKLGGNLGLAASRNGKTLYVAQGPYLVPVNTATHKTGKRIRIAGKAIGDAIVGMILSPNGRTLYLTTENSQSNQLVPVNTATNKPGKAISLKCAPGDMVITPNGKSIYIVCPLANAVIPVRFAAGRAGRAIPTGTFPNPIVITPNGKTVYVGTNKTLGGAGIAIPISTKTNKAGGAISAGSFPLVMAITPNGRSIFVVSGASSYVTQISAVKNTTLRSILVGYSMEDIAITPNGTTAYVTTQGSSSVPTNGYRSVTPINVSSGRPGPAILIPHAVGALDIAITPNGKTAYVSNIGNGNPHAVGTAVTPIRLSTGRALTGIQVGQGPGRLLITP
jgi:DNA-binding beta-propeller fold protein YncE